VCVCVCVCVFVNKHKNAVLMSMPQFKRELVFFSSKKSQGKDGMDFFLHRHHHQQKLPVMRVCACARVCKKTKEREKRKKRKKDGKREKKEKRTRALILFLKGFELPHGDRPLVECLILHALGSSER
jgi:hypothetical protein